MQELILLPEEESIGERAGKYLAVQLPQYSRSFFQKLFKDDQIQIQKHADQGELPHYRRRRNRTYNPGCPEAGYCSGKHSAGYSV